MSSAAVEDDRARREGITASRIDHSDRRRRMDGTMPATHDGLPPCRGNHRLTGKKFRTQSQHAALSSLPSHSTTLAPQIIMSAVIETLHQLEADHSVFYRKLRAFHWSVNGPAFFTLHQKFEELYTDVATKVDMLAERVLTLGGRPIPTYAAVLETARLSEISEMPDAIGMVEALYTDLRRLNRWTRTAIEQAGECGDIGTTSMLENFVVEGEKEAWMLRSFLGKTESVNA